MRARILPIVLVFFSGCSWLGLTSNPVAGSDLSFELYMSHGSDTGTVDFEQYKLLPVGLFAECGSGRGGKYDARQQSIFDVTSGTFEQLVDLSSKVMARMQQGPPPSLDAPGTNDNPLDPGKYILTLRNSTSRVEIRTSLDAVRRTSSERGGLLKQFAELLRGSTGEPPCGRSSFYGIAMNPAS